MRWKHALSDKPASRASIGKGVLRDAMTANLDSSDLGGHFR